MRWGRNINRLPLSHTPRLGTESATQACPHRELNRWPFAWQDDAQPTEPHRSGKWAPFKDCFPFIDSREMGREGERERNIHWLVLTCSPTRTEPATQACALHGKGTGHLSVCRTSPNPLSHTSQGSFLTNIQVFMFFWVVT